MKTIADWERPLPAEIAVAILTSRLPRRSTRITGSIAAFSTRQSKGVNATAIIRGTKTIGFITLPMMSVVSIWFIPTAREATMMARINVPRASNFPSSPRPVTGSIRKPHGNYYCCDRNVDEEEPLPA